LLRGESRPERRGYVESIGAFIPWIPEWKRALSAETSGGHETVTRILRYVYRRMVMLLGRISMVKQRRAYGYWNRRAFLPRILDLFHTD
jgi:hypothetical protein